MGMPTKRVQIPSRTTEAGKALDRPTRAEVLARLQPAANDPTYALGRSADEHQRLQQQAALFRPITERFFRSAGLAPGMRVLDVGSGAGDVVFLAAEVVGPTGPHRLHRRGPWCARRPRRT